MSTPAGFLGGAVGRLLPASVALRYFAAAAIFQVAGWVVAAWHADSLAGHAGGLGPPLAALHLFALGVLATTAIGAAVQLLPVATRQPIRAAWPVRLLSWLFLPGVAWLAAGMYGSGSGALIGGAAASAAGLLLFAALLADNLHRARSLPVVAAFGWLAVPALVATAVLGLVLAVDFARPMLGDHAAAARVHMVCGVFGFMGLLALGFSHVLVPMFALAVAPPSRPARAGLAVAAVAVAFGIVGAVTGSTGLLAVALLAGLGAAAIHLRLMTRALRNGMRRRLGVSFVLVRAAWLLLPLALGVGLADLAGVAGARGGVLFVVCAVGGWLLTFLLGILQRILPFLASMHAPRAPGGAPRRLSELASTAPLHIHAACHIVALAALGSGILADVPAVVQFATLAGLAGALAWGSFTATVLGRLRGGGATP